MKKIGIVGKSRYIDANKLVRAMTLQANRTMLGEIAPPQLSYSEMLDLVADAPTADVVEVRHEMNLDEATRVHFVGERCLKIYRGELPDSECLNCVYKHLGVDCALALIEAQHKIITEILEKQNVDKSKNDK